MPDERIEFLSAVLLVSDDPERLARFYRDAIGIPLEEERHDDLEKHWGCELGDLHFAIHPASSFPDGRRGVGSVRLAFVVFDLDAFAKRLAERGVASLGPPKEEAFGRVLAMRDPDGNALEFTQLSDDWFRHLEDRKRRGIDVVGRWRECRSTDR